MPKLHRTREGRTLCGPHATTGRPAFHTNGCDACAEARAKGIVRLDAESVPKKERGRARFRERRIDWDKIKPENRAALAEALQAGRRTNGSC
jgi:hypothetical protein